MIAFTNNAPPAESARINGAKSKRAETPKGTSRLETASPQIRVLRCNEKVNDRVTRTSGSSQMSLKTNSRRLPETQASHPNRHLSHQRSPAGTQG